jgi:hypothetical protein
MYNFGAEGKRPEQLYNSHISTMVGCNLVMTTIYKLLELGCPYISKGKEEKIR